MMGMSARSIKVGLVVSEMNSPILTMNGHMTSMVNESPLSPIRYIMQAFLQEKFNRKWKKTFYQGQTMSTDRVGISYT